MVRTHECLLKQKYAHMHSVDFTLPFVMGGWGCVLVLVLFCLVRVCGVDWAEQAGPGGKLVLTLVERGKPYLNEGATVVFPGGYSDAIRFAMASCNRTALNHSTCYYSRSSRTH